MDINKSYSEDSITMSVGPSKENIDNNEATTILTQNVKDIVGVEMRDMQMVETKVIHNNALSKNVFDTHISIQNSEQASIVFKDKGENAKLVMDQVLQNPDLIKNNSNNELEQYAQYELVLLNDTIKDTLNENNNVEFNVTLESEIQNYPRYQEVFIDIPQMITNVFSDKDFTIIRDEERYVFNDGDQRTSLYQQYLAPFQIHSFIV